MSARKITELQSVPGCWGQYGQRVNEEAGCEKCGQSCPHRYTCFDRWHGNPPGTTVGNLSRAPE